MTTESADTPKCRELVQVNCAYASTCGNDLPCPDHPAVETPTEPMTSAPVHARVFEYDGAFRCHDCKKEWGALPGHPTEPPTCVNEERCVLDAGDRRLYCTAHGSTWECVAERIRTLQSALTAAEKERDEIREAFKCKVCNCGTPRDSCNGGLRHEAREFEGGMGCGTCYDAIRVVNVPELDKGGQPKYFCVREILDHLCHAEFESDSRALDLQKAEEKIAALEANDRRRHAVDNECRLYELRLVERMIAEPHRIQAFYPAKFYQYVVAALDRLDSLQSENAKLSGYLDRHRAAGHVLTEGGATCTHTRDAAAKMENRS